MVFKIDGVYPYAETLDGKANQIYSFDGNALWEIARP